MSTGFLPRPPRVIRGLPAKIAAQYYAKMQHMVLRMASRPGGVGRKEIMARLGVTRLAADRLISDLGLVHAQTIGRTEFFTLPEYLSEFLEPTQAETSSRQSSRLEKQMRRLHLELRQTASHLLSLYSSWYVLQLQRSLNNEEVSPLPIFRSDELDEEDNRPPPPKPGVDYIEGFGDFADESIDSFSLYTTPEEDLEDEEIGPDEDEPAPVLTSSPDEDDDEDDDEDEDDDDDDAPPLRRQAPVRRRSPRKKKKGPPRHRVTRNLSFGEAIRLLAQDPPSDDDQEQTLSDDDSDDDDETNAAETVIPAIKEAPSASLEMYDEFCYRFYPKQAPCRNSQQLQAVLESYGIFEKLEEVWSSLDEEWVYDEEDWSPFVAMKERNLEYLRLCRERGISLTSLRR